MEIPIDGMKKWVGHIPGPEEEELSLFNMELRATKAQNVNLLKALADERKACLLLQKKVEELSHQLDDAYWRA